MSSKSYSFPSDLGLNKPSIISSWAAPENQILTINAGDFKLAKTAANVIDRTITFKLQDQTFKVTEDELETVMQRPVGEPIKLKVYDTVKMDITYLDVDLLQQVANAFGVSPQSIPPEPKLPVPDQIDFMEDRTW